MAAVAEIGSFVMNTGTGNQTISHSLGVTPKFIIVWGERLAAGSFGVPTQNVFGFSDGTNDACVSTTIEDAAGTSDTYRSIRDSLIYVRTITGVTFIDATLSSWDSSNFVVNLATAGANPMTINYLLVGGDGISAFVGDMVSKTSTGNHSETGVGFKPEWVMIAEVGGSISGFPVNGNSAIMGIGAMDNAGNQGVMEIHDIDAAPTTDCARIQFTDAVQCAITSGGTNARKAAFVSMDSDGFTINYSLNFAEANPMIYLAVKGLRVKVGNFTKATGGAPASQSVTTDFQPIAVLMWGVQNTASGSGAAHARLGIGGYDGSHERAMAFASEDNNTTSSVDAIIKTDKVFIKVNNTTATIDAEADGVSLDATGFSLSWSTNDAVATQILYLALGSYPELTDTVTISDDVLRNKAFTITDTVTMAEALALPVRDLTIADLVSIAEAIEVQFGVLQVDIADSFSIAETLLISAILTVTDDITITDLIGRLVELTDGLTIAEVISMTTKEIWLTDTVTINELAGIFYYLTDTVTISDEITLGRIIEIAETVGVSDAVAVAVAILINEGITLTDVIERLANITDSVTVSEILSLLKQNPQTEQARFQDSILVMKQNDAAFAEPESFYYSRNRKRYVTLHRARRVLSS